MREGFNHQRLRIRLLWADSQENLMSNADELMRNADESIRNANETNRLLRPTSSSSLFSLIA
jgi:hypothetical protein